MSPIKNTLAFVLFVIVVIGFLYALSGDRSPRVPSDALHNGVASREDCLKCHGPGKDAALKETHPPKDQCMLCHKRKRNVREK